ncbi:hypothetical protein N9A45_00760 [bacterium]|nr:hypothetical protein [bacterium]
MNLRYIITIILMANTQTLVLASETTLCGLGPAEMDRLTCSPVLNDGWYAPCAETCSDLKQAFENPYFNYSDYVNCSNSWSQVANLITETRNLLEIEMMHFDIPNATSLPQCVSNTAEWFVITHRDCAGTFNGNAVLDVCDVCDGDGSSCADCVGTPNGNAVLDVCDVCDGDGSSCADEEQTPSAPFANIQTQILAIGIIIVGLVFCCVSINRNRNETENQNNKRVKRARKAELNVTSAELEGGLANLTF